MAKGYRVDWGRENSGFPFYPFTTTDKTDLEYFTVNVKALGYNIYKIDIVNIPEIIDDFINK